MKRGLFIVAGFLIALAAFAQRGRFEEPDDDEKLGPARNAEFHFLRLEYTDLPQYHRRWGYSSRDGTGAGWWLVDWPCRRQSFHLRHPAPDPHRYPATRAISRYTILTTGFSIIPWIYATQKPAGGA